MGEINLMDRNLSEKVKLTRMARKLTVGGETKEYQVYKIRLDLLRYNAQNDRIATRMSEYAEGHNGQLPDSSNQEEFNSIIEEYIVNSNPDRMAATELSIKENGQQEPGVVLANGLVIDGNRRFTCLRRLARKNDQFNWFEASILPSSIGDDRETIKCLELALQFGREERVGYDPIDRLVGIYRDLIDPETKIETLTQEKYARSAGINTSELNKLMKQANLMVEFLKFANADKHFSLARTLKISGPLGELDALFIKCSDEAQIERVKTHAFANILVEPEDITRFIRKMKKIVGKGNCEDYLQQEDDLAAEVADRLGALETVDAVSIRNEIRGDENLKQQMLEVVSNAEKNAKRSKLLDSPKKAIDDAREHLGEVDLEILESLPSELKQDVKQSLDNLRDSIDRIDAVLAE